LRGLATNNICSFGDTRLEILQHAHPSNELRARLFRMVAEDAKQRKAAFALLGQIEEWRLDHGRPTGEPRHPDFSSRAAVTTRRNPPPDDLYCRSHSDDCPRSPGQSWPQRMNRFCPTSLHVLIVRRREKGTGFVL